MQEIRCPKCGEVFQVDETGYDQIARQVRDKEFIKDNYKLGFSDVRVITSKNAYRLSNYVDKLTLHAIKQETKNRYSIISSRGDFAFTDILNNHRLMNYKESDFDIWN